MMIMDGVFYVITHHRTILYFDDLTCEIRNGNIIEAPLNLTLSICDGRLEFNYEVKKLNRLSRLSLPYYQLKNLLLHEVGCNLFAFETSHSFMSAYPDGGVSFDCKWNREWEHYRLIPVESSENINVIPRRLWPEVLSEMLLKSWVQAHQHIEVSDKRITATNVRLMLVVSWLVIGGAEKLFFDIVSNIGDDFEVTIVTTAPSTNNWAWKFQDKVARIINLPEFGTQHFVHDALVLLIDLLNINSVLLSNSREGLSALPALRDHYPNLLINDLVFGAGAPDAMGGYPVISAPYDKFLNFRLVITDYTKRLQLDNGIEEDRIKLIYCGTDTDYFNPELYIHVNRKPVIAFVGRFVQEKRPDLIIAVARAVSREIPCVFKMIGDGPLMQSISDDIRIDPPFHTVELLGNVVDVRDVLAEASAFVFCPEEEGFGLAVSEAMSMQVPIVASAVGGIPEQVRDGVDGFLIPFNTDMIQIAAMRITDLLSNDDLRRSMGNNGRNRIISDLSITSMIRRYRQFLQPQQ